MEITTKGSKIIIECSSYSTKEMMLLLAVLPRWRYFAEQIPNKELIDKIKTEKVDWTLYKFHMAGIQELHHFLTNIKDLVQADMFIVDEVSNPSIEEAEA